MTHLSAAFSCFLCQAVAALAHWSDTVRSQLSSDVPFLKLVHSPPASTDAEPWGRAGPLNRGISPFWRCSNSTSLLLLGEQLCLDLSLLPACPSVHRLLSRAALCLSVTHSCFCDGGKSGLTFPFLISAQRQGPVGRHI